jgi:hypothetical protein
MKKMFKRVLVFLLGTGVWYKDIMHSHIDPRIQQDIQRISVFVLHVTVFVFLPFMMVSFPQVAAADFCDPPVTNPIPCENSKTGSPQSEWDQTYSFNTSGYADDFSVNLGQTVNFKISTPSTNYRIDIYRVGYYQGLGARKIATFFPSVSLPQMQPACIKDDTVGLIDCGNWAVSASWTVPSDAVSGVYFAKVTRLDAANQSTHIYFVVRDDYRHAPMLFQTSDTTWQAYNLYGGVNLYENLCGRYGFVCTYPLSKTRGYKVSYNRPFYMFYRIYTSFFESEYSMVRWIEKNGYDVSYFTGLDAARSGAEILNHKAFLSVGHDEYWSAEQRNNVTAAREAGVNLGFFTANEVFWKTRWENSIDTNNTPFKTMVCYKESQDGIRLDPLENVWTGTWRDPRFSPPADGGKPENALTGTLYSVINFGADFFEVSSEFSKLRFWRNTSVANLSPGQSVAFPPGTLGYEFNEDKDNGSRPPGLFRLSSTPRTEATYLLDYGEEYGTGSAIHNMTIYRDATSGALVFSAATIHWSWGLDDKHITNQVFTGAPPSRDMQQATVNIFADMGILPATPQNDVIVQVLPADNVAPKTFLTSASVLPKGVGILVEGTATDVGGVVAGVEVSVDGGQRWHPAVGTAKWSYTWKPTTMQTLPVPIVQGRAVDDSGNIGAATPARRLQPCVPTSLRRCAN